MTIAKRTLSAAALRTCQSDTHKQQTKRAQGCRAWKKTTRPLSPHADSPHCFQAYASKITFSTCVGKHFAHFQGMWQRSDSCTAIEHCIEKLLPASAVICGSVKSSARLMGKEMPCNSIFSGPKNGRFKPLRQRRLFVVRQPTLYFVTWSRSKLCDL